MAKKNDNDGTIGFLLFILVILAVGAFFLIKWAIIGLIILISSIVVWIKNTSKKNKNKNYLNNIIEKNFDNSILKPVPKITCKELKEKLGLFDIDIYDDIFENKIKPRGQMYYANRRIENVKNKDDFWSCEIKGTDRYKVSIKFDGDKIVETNCTCPYHNEDQKNCKHIYALLIKAKTENNLPKILDAITDYSNRLGKVIEKETNYIEKNKINLKLNEQEIQLLNNNIDNFVTKLKNISNLLESNKFNESVLLNLLIGIIEESYITIKGIEEILIKSGKIENPVSINKVYNTYKNNNDDTLKMSDVIVGATIANEVDKHFHKDDDIDEELEKEMDAYELEDWQKDLVRKGEYNPWNFEEDGELEEDDYYYEDDDINND